MKCTECNRDTDNPKFCSKSCSAKHNNRLRKDVKFCENCSTELQTHQTKFCSHSCQHEKQWFNTVIQIEKNKCADNHKQAKKYITYKNGNKCSICDIDKWMGKELPMILDHIDGNYSNHRLDNIRLVCSNCDSQLPTYKSKNKKGRHKRRKRYQQGKSY